jgi:hypothetical protein
MDRAGNQNAECRLRNAEWNKRNINSEFYIPNSELGNARSARRILRKPVEASKERANPADAFAQKLLAPGPRPRHPGNVKRCETPRQSRGPTLKIIGKLILILIDFRKFYKIATMRVEGGFPPSGACWHQNPSS